MEDLKTKGYTVIPNFLTTEEIQIFLDDYKKQQSIVSPSLKGHVHIADISYNAANSINKKIHEISKLSGLNADTVVPNGFYTNTTKAVMMWHQDHGSYFVFQQAYDYLNFYIAIDKPDPTVTGISVVPMDALEAAAPNDFHKIFNSAAKRFVPEGDITRVWDDENGGEWTLPVNLDSIMDNPKIAVGDLLLMRGDVIHKTQDNLTRRVAISVRSTNGSAIINAEKLKTGCRMKQQMTKDISKKYNAVFERLNKQEVTAYEMLRELSPWADL
jgi:ectoine hydroxylase-related dioxygenase (phytanoyl-CoA dioxygenase family)